VVSIVRDSSTVMTPSLPTFFMASAMMLPICLSLLAEIVRLARSCRLDVTMELLDFLDRASTARSMPRFRRGRACTGRHRLHAFAEDGLSQHGRRCGAVTATSEVFEATSAHHLCAHVLERILQLDFLRYRYAVLSDDRRAELLFDDRVPALGPERDLHGVG